MSKAKTLFLALLIVVSGWMVGNVDAALSVPYTFSPLQVISSSQMNANFTAITDWGVDKRGDTLIGTLTTRALAVSTHNLYDVGTTATRYKDGYFAGVMYAAGGLNVGGVATVNSSGQIPAISSVYFASLSGANLTALNGTNVASGTVTCGVGGTGLISYAIGDIPYASASCTLAKLADVAAGNVLLSGGVATAPAYGKVTNAHIDAAAAIAWTKLDKTGSSLVDLTTKSAAALDSGTLSDLRLSSNVPLKNGINTFTANQIVSGARSQSAIGLDIASANDLTLGSDGNAFNITGTTQINRIATANWQAGSVVRIFVANLTVKHGQVSGGGFSRILLNGSVDLVAGANGAMLTFMLFGASDWYEVSRMVL